MNLKIILIAVIYCLCHLFIEINGQCPTNTKNCSQCISESFECFWCTDLNFEPRERCGNREYLKRIRCVEVIGYDESSNKVVVKKDDKFSEKTGESSDNIIQLRPQRVGIKLRPKSEVSIGISYKRAVDYPMDLYFLMDLSCTMKPHKQTLSNVAEKLRETITKVTKNFKLGFGSYVDKPIMPFSAFEIKPVECGSIYGDPPYSYRHRQSLTSNDKLFATEVNNSKTSGNVDSPEGTLDALMQVMTCDSLIGWRDHSHKIIVVATDEQFHYAGDGKLAGILTPNDGQCHMIDSNTYSHFNVTDYPSMHQIANVVKEKGFNIVFSVHNDVRDIYRVLKNIIGDNARVADLNNDHDKTTNLIKEVYNNILSEVQLSQTKTSDFVDIKIIAECEPGIKTETNKCEFKNIKEIKFEAKILLKYCPSDERLWKQELEIGLSNNKKDVLKIDLEMLCKCDCDNNPAPNSAQCSSEGTLACGKCRQCNGRRIGHTCDCNPDTERDPRDAEKHCKNSSLTNPSICSNRGKCGCNTCICNRGYKGPYCETDSSGCYPQRNVDNDECNNRGVCTDLGQCKCDKGYNQSVGLCDCFISDENCISNTTSGEICSNNGKCVCNSCICNEKSIKGSLCQHCPRCEFDKNEFCNKILECVPEICQIFYGKKDNCTQKCEPDFNYIFTKNLTMINSTVDHFKKKCYSQTEDKKCVVEYEFDVIIVNERSGGKSFRVSEPIRSCQFRADPIVLSSSVVGGIILVGLALLLLWKLLTEIWDRKEYARFQKELSKANWEQSENPLYKEAKSTFTNPMFNLRERAQKRLSRITERFSRRFDVNT